MTIPEITLTGTPRERGRHHGAAAHDLIGRALRRWADHFSGPVDKAMLLDNLMDDTGLLEAAELHAPDLVEEVRGMAEGANQPFAEMFCWQLIDEGWWLAAEMADRAAPLERCSALAVNHRNSGVVAQTQDLDRHFDGSQVFLRRVEEDGLQILSPSLAGLLALNGVNSAGLAVAVTTLSSLPHSVNGVSSGFLVPMLLRCRSIDDAVGLLHTLPISSGNSFLLGTRDRSVVVEVSADAISIDEDARVLHTNHPLHLDPVRDYLRFTSSYDRLTQLERLVTAESTGDDLEAVYSTQPVCQSRSGPSAFVTLGTMIFELGDEQVCRFAAGPLDSDPLVDYQMDKEQP
jgi:predicted choloylglycine hydrolase